MLAVVTGGARGIGAAIARRLRTANHTVCVVDRRAPEDAAPHFVQADLAVAGGGRAAIQEIARTLGVPDVVVNNAGIYHSREVDGFSWDEYHEVLQVNLHSAIEVVLAWKETCERGPTRRVVNVISAAALLGSRDIAYAASKTAMVGVTRSLAANLARDGILVFGVAPGLIDTAMSRAMAEARREEHVGRTLLKRAGRPEEVAELVAFLAEGYGDYMTGSTVNVSCGLAP